MWHRIQPPSNRSNLRRLSLGEVGLRTCGPSFPHSVRAHREHRTLLEISSIVSPDRPDASLVQGPSPATVARLMEMSRFPVSPVIPVLMSPYSRAPCSSESISGPERCVLFATVSTAMFEGEDEGRLIRSIIVVDLGRPLRLSLERLNFCRGT